MCEYPNKSSVELWNKSIFSKSNLKHENIAKNAELIEHIRKLWSKYRNLENKQQDVLYDAFKARL
jgi:hypothetical protein